NFRNSPPSCSRVFSTNSPASLSNIAIVCCRACRSHPIIRISASFDPSSVRWTPHSLLGSSLRPTSLCHHLSQSEIAGDKRISRHLSGLILHRFNSNDLLQLRVLRLGLLQDGDVGVGVL